MSHHFHVTLPSDSSLNYYPNNTVAHYITKLSERIHLDGEYEVGLAEIIYPHSWFNVNNEDGKYWIATWEAGTLRDKAYIRSGYYSDENAFMKHLTDEAAQALGSDEELIARFVYDATSSKVTIEMKMRDTVRNLALSPSLKRFLGFTGSWVAIRTHSLIADETFEFNNDLSLMYVYCDIATYTAVGDTKAPLLRVCNVSGQHREIVRITYSHPYYIPLARRDFDTIEININDGLGQPMPFEFGKSVVTLHFRRKHEETILLRR